MKHITAEKLRSNLGKSIKPPVTQERLAEALGISPSYLSEVLRGRKEPGAKLLYALGLERRMVYVEVAKS